MLDLLCRYVKLYENQRQLSLHRECKRLRNGGSRGRLHYNGRWQRNSSWTCLSNPAAWFPTADFYLHKAYTQNQLRTLAVAGYLIFTTVRIVSERGPASFHRNAKSYSVKVDFVFAERESEKNHWRNRDLPDWSVEILPWVECANASPHSISTAPQSGKSNTWPFEIHSNISTSETIYTAFRTLKRILS